MMCSNQNKDKRYALRNSIRDKQIKSIFRHQRFVLQIASNMTQGQLKQNNILDAWSQVQTKILSFRYCQQVQKEKILKQIAKLSDYIGLNENLQKGVSILDFLIKTIQVQNGNIIKICSKALEQIIFKIKKGSELLQNSIFETLIQTIKLKSVKQTSTFVDLLSLINCIIYKSPHHSQVFYKQQFVLKLLQILQSNNHQYSQSDFEIVQSLIFRLLKSSDLDKLQQWQIPFLNKLVFIQISQKWSQHQDLFRISLKILATLASSNNQNVLHILWMCQGLIQSIMKLTINSQPVIRSIVVNMLANLTTTNNKNRILQYLSLCNSLEDNHKQCSNSSLKLLSNIVATSVESANFVLQHKIFKQVIIYFANQPQYHKNCVDAIFILSTLIFYDDFDISLNLIAIPDYQILKLLINAVCIPYEQASFYVDAISAFIKILSILKIIGYQAYLQVVVFLKNAGLENKLIEVQQSMGNKKITKLITILLEQTNSYH